MDYTFIKKTLPFQNIAGQVVFNEERMWLNDVRGEIFSGQAHGALDLALGGKGSTKDYTASHRRQGPRFRAADEAVLRL